MNNQLQTIADHAEYLFILTAIVRNKGLMELAQEIETVADSLRRLDEQNDIVITPSATFF